MDDDKYNRRFDEAERVMGKPAADALRKLYDFYGKNWLNWLASLYDAKTGFFYYANSARDNDGFLPDCESTCQTLGIVSYAGMMEHYNYNYIEAYPKRMRDANTAYIKSMQSDEDGYFYHPQWGSKIGDARRGRDFSQCLTILSNFGERPLYPTATERLSDVAEGKCEAEETSLPPHLLSKEAMLEYLERGDVNHNSHSTGHILSSQTAQIVAAGLGDFVADYIEARQNPETGLWEEEANYSSLSGVIKISALLSGLGRDIKYGDKIIESGIKVIMSDVDPAFIIYIFNPWGGLGTSVASAAKVYDEYIARGETPPYDMPAIRRSIYDRLPAMIDKTIEKLSKFRKPDGSFSYEQHRSAPTTQGVPVSLGLYEGDVNGLACAMQYTISSIFSALGIPRIPMCNNDDFLDFRAKIEAAHDRLEVK